MESRRDGHMEVLEARAALYIYITRVPATEAFVIRVVESMIATQLT